MLPHIILVGGGGHALVVAEAAQLSGVAVDGFVDDATDPLLARLTRLTRLGIFSDLSGLSVPLILCVGFVSARRRVLAQNDFTRCGGVTHPTAFVSPSATVGKGVFIGPHAIVHSRADIGDHAIINSGAIVEHECVLATNVHIGPGAVLAGNVAVGAHTLIGMGARVMPGVLIGSGCTIGAGAVVVEDVADETTVKGVPAR